MVIDIFVCKRCIVYISFKQEITKNKHIDKTNVKIKDWIKTSM